MFGSNFGANFGLPDIQLQGADPQGGLFGTNAPQQPGADASNPGLNLSASPAAAPLAPPTGVAPGGPSPSPALGPSASPLGGGPLSAGAGAAGSAFPPLDAVTAQEASSAELLKRNMDWLGKIKLRDAMGGQAPWTSWKSQRNPQEAQGEMRGQMESSKEISNAVPRGP